MASQELEEAQLRLLESERAAAVNIEQSKKQVKEAREALDELRVAQERDDKLEEKVTRAEERLCSAMDGQVRCRQVMGAIIEEMVSMRPALEEARNMSIQALVEVRRVRDMVMPPGERKAIKK